MMKKKKGYRNGGKIKGMMMGGRMKAKGMKVQKINYCAMIYPVDNIPCGSANNET